MMKTATRAANQNQAAVSLTAACPLCQRRSTTRAHVATPLPTARQPPKRPGRHHASGRVAHAALLGAILACLTATGT